MRAVKDSLATPLEGKVGKNRKDRVGLLCSRNAQPPKALAGLMARLGVPVGGRVRKLRAVGGQTGHPPVRGGVSVEGA